MSDIKATDYFETAKQIVREHAAETLAKIKKPRKTWDFETVVYVVDIEGQDWEISVGISYDCTYDPGVYSVAWEDSYPASGDMDLTDIVILCDLPATITEAMVKLAASCERIEEEAWEDYHDKTRGGDE